MNNLAVLFELEGRPEEQAYWERQLARYRDANPYYHAWLGDEAGANPASGGGGEQLRAGPGACTG